MIRMVVSDQYTQDALHGYVHILQELANSTCRNSRINQDPIKLITQVIAVSAAATAKTKKIAFGRGDIQGLKDQYLLAK